MKICAFLLLITFITTACRPDKGSESFTPEDLRKRPPFYPEDNSLYPAAMKLKLRVMMDANLPWDSIIHETSKLIARDTFLLARDSLRTSVQLEVNPPYTNYYARVNGFKIKDQQLDLSLFPDSICLAVAGYGMQGKFEGTLVVNGIRKTFKIDPYRNNRLTIVKFSLKDFKESLPLKPKPVVPLTDSLLAAL